MDNSALDRIVALARKRAQGHVQTPEGEKKYGEPIGAPITRDMVEKAKSVTKAVSAKATVNADGSEKIDWTRPASKVVPKKAEPGKVNWDRPGEVRLPKKVLGPGETLKPLGIDGKPKWPGPYRSHRDIDLNAEFKPLVAKLKAATTPNAPVKTAVESLAAKKSAPKKFKQTTLKDPLPPLTDAEYAAWASRVESRINAAFAAKLDTQSQNSKPGRGDARIWTAERTAIHKEILEEIYSKAANVPNEGKALISGGLGGAGKTTTLGKFAGVDLDSYMTVNADDIKEIMYKRGLVPKIEGLSPAESVALVHAESAYLARELAKRAHIDRKNLLYDITMSGVGDGPQDSQKRIDQLLRNGYSVDGIFVDIPVEKSVERALARHREGLEDYRNGKGWGGRYVPPSVIRENASSGEFHSSNRELFQNQKWQFSEFRIYDNSADRTAGSLTPPKLVSTTPGFYDSVRGKKGESRGPVLEEMQVATTGSKIRNGSIVYSKQGPDSWAAPNGQKYSSEEIMLEAKDLSWWNPNGTRKPTHVSGTGTKADPIKTNDVAVAANALNENKYVELESDRQVSTLLDKLSAIVDEAKSKGKAAPVFDLCKVTVAKTNLFCSQSKGVPRVMMPQLKGIPVKGSDADKMTKNDKGEVDLGPAFIDFLKTKGISVSEDEIDAAYLKASQIELNGAKIAGMSRAMQAGKVPNEAIFTTADDYIVDGHHRWAANVANEIRVSEAIIMPIMRIDAPIIRVLALANFFSKHKGIPQAGVGAPPVTSNADKARAGVSGTASEQVAAKQAVNA